MKELRVFYVFIVYFSCVFLCHGERTKDKMYKSINVATPCFRRLNGTHQTGCSSHRGGSLGVVHYVETKEELHFIIENGTAGPYVPVMPTTLLTLEIAMLLKGSEKISGLALFKTNDTPAHYSHEDSCPNRYSSLANTCSKNWNPYGTGLLNEDFHFAIFYINEEEDVANIRDCFKKFNNYSYNDQYERSLCSIELSAFMFATTDTPTCIRRSNSVTNFNPVKFCDPLGDENVWASLFPVANTSTVKLKDKMKYIVLSARLDSTSLFLDVVPGAVNPVTGMVALLATAQFLKKILPKYETGYEHNVLFVLFNGESYDYIGSQRLLYDMEKGEFPTLFNKTAEYPVPPITIDDISLFIEFGQLGKGEQVHIFNLNSTPETRDYLTKLEKRKRNWFKEEKSGVLPPVSLQTFFKARPNISGIVLASHGDVFTNKFYNSMYDNASNLDYHYYNDTEDIPLDSIQAFITNVSTEVGLSVYEQITHNDLEGFEKASLRTVNELLNCYLVNANCDVHKAIQRKKLREEPFSLYVSVSVTRNAITSLAGLTLAWFTGEVVNGDGPCEGGMKSHVYQYFNMSKDLDDLNKTICFQTTLNFTEALSPAFLIDDYDWKSGKYSSWSESSWREVHARIFLKPSASHERMTIAIGSLTLVFSVMFVYFVKSRSHILFAPPADITPTNC